MSFLPQNYEGAWTLAQVVSRQGIGLHSGNECSVSLGPSEKVGFYLSWVDSPDLPLRLKAGQVLESQLCTTLQVGNHRLATVEHLLAALAGCGLTHVNIKVSGEEIPLLDGSALCWVEAISEAGLTPAPTPRELPISLGKPIAINRGNSVICATPSEKFSLVGIIDFPYPSIGKQMLSIDLTPSRFVQDIAPARTFGFIDQLDQLKAAGLIRGGTLENALVCDHERWLNPPLRFADEPIRHKLLDLIGDLALCGFPKAQVIVYKGSHGLHSQLATALLQECTPR